MEKAQAIISVILKVLMWAGIVALGLVILKWLFTGFALWAILGLIL